MNSEASASTGSTLVVVGAGPKGLAVAAKQAVLRRLGIATPEVYLLDRSGVAAHWSGAHGYTDGRRLLGTSPEKDIGFPYDSCAWGDTDVNRAVDRAMFEYSWQSYLVATYRYSEWIDRDRNRPTHDEWSMYLRWVNEVVRPNVVVGELARLHVSDDGRWRVRYRTSGSDEGEIAADGVVITGPGRATRLRGQPENHPRVLDGASVWQALDSLQSDRRSNASVRVGVVGSGETAAAVVLALLELLGERAQISVVVPHGVLYTRDEGYEENRLFSDPDPHDGDVSTSHQHARRWLNLTREDRREFVSRTDRGVFSTQALREIIRVHNVRSLIGMANVIEASDSEVRLTVSYNGVDETHAFDHLVVATGFDPLWFADHLSQPARERVQAAVGVLNNASLEAVVGYDLAVSGLTPRLHVPMLSAMAQGPGFPNLSCLGLLSERILSAYATAR